MRRMREDMNEEMTERDAVEMLRRAKQMLAADGKYDAMVYGSNGLTPPAQFAVDFALSLFADPPPDVIRRIEGEFAARMVEDAIAAVIRTEKYEYHYSPGKEWGWCKADLQTGKYVEKSTGPDPRWYSTLTEAMEAELGREG
jgi:hypothetical protein